MTEQVCLPPISRDTGSMGSYMIANSWIRRTLSLIYACCPARSKPFVGHFSKFARHVRRVWWISHTLQFVGEFHGGRGGALSQFLYTVVTFDFKTWNQCWAQITFFKVAIDLKQSLPKCYLILRVDMSPACWHFGLKCARNKWINISNTSLHITTHRCAQLFRHCRHFLTPLIPPSARWLLSSTRWD